MHVNVSILGGLMFMMSFIGLPGQDSIILVRRHFAAILTSAALNNKRTISSLDAKVYL